MQLYQNNFCAKQKGSYLDIRLWSCNKYCLISKYSFIPFTVQTNSKYVFAISGTGHCGMEAMVFNMVEPGDVVLVADHGIWGERFADLCLR